MNVLFMDYGTPYNATEIEPYYTDIRRGRPPTAELLHELQERYELIGRSPLNEISYAQAAKLESALNSVLPQYSHNLTASAGARIRQSARVYRGTKHWHPYLKEAVHTMAQDGVTKAVGIVAAPHFSARSIAEYQHMVEQALAELEQPFKFSMIKQYHTHPGYIAALAHRVQEQMWRLHNPSTALFLFTAHSIPVRAAADGIYQGQIAETAQLVANTLGIKNWEIAWQSAGRTPEPWIGPDINERIAELEGVTEAVVTAVGFPSDHLEVYYDLDYEAMLSAKDKGIRLFRTRSLNTDPDYIEVLKDVSLKAWNEL